MEKELARRVWIKNAAGIMSHGNTGLRRVAIDALEAGLTAADPYALTKRLIRIEEETLLVGEDRIPLGELRRLFVVGAGKGSFPICQALEEGLGDRITRGVLSVKAGESRRLKQIQVIEAGHPVPDARSLEAGEAILAILQNADQRDVIFGAITGGVSALMEVPVQGLTLVDIQRTNQLLLNAGMTIAEMNAVRKHLSRLKGGWMAQHARPARLFVITLGTTPEGLAWPDPTKPDPSTFDDAIRVLKRQDLWNKVPLAVQTHLSKGLADSTLETPKNFQGYVVPHFDVGNQAMACEAAAAAVSQQGFRGVILSTHIVGEARDVGTALAGIAKEAQKSGRPFSPPCVFVSGGEVTTNVRNPNGVGGPNQEFVVAAAGIISGLPNVVVASIDTDGSDGPTDTAGGIADGETVSRAKSMGLDLADVLAQNDTGTALRRLGDAIYTGPTGTNVINLRVIVVGGTSQ
jgi:glycerate 2-kinase